MLLYSSLYFVSPQKQPWRQRVLHTHVTCICSYVQKRILGLTHKESFPKRISFGPLSDVTAVLGMRQSIVLNGHVHFHVLHALIMQPHGTGKYNVLICKQRHFNNFLDSVNRLRPDTEWNDNDNNNNNKKDGRWFIYRNLRGSMRQILRNLTVYRWIYACVMHINISRANYRLEFRCIYIFAIPIFGVSSIKIFIVIL